jgi:hypothetical protein
MAVMMNKTLMSSIASLRATSLPRSKAHRLPLGM